jgi:hypothetical protein
MVTCVALVAVTVRVDDWPAFIEVGLAVMLIVGVGAGAAATVTVAVAEALPPFPVAEAV